jgi:hypothetical protein
MARIDTRMAIGSIMTAIVKLIGVTIIEKTSTVVARTAFAIAQVTIPRAPGA